MLLTSELMRERLDFLRARVEAEHGPSELIFETGYCDGCRRPLIFDPSDPGSLERAVAGWTTSGDLEHGFVDHCPECTRGT